MKHTIFFILLLVINFSIDAQELTESLRLEALENIRKEKYGEAIELLNRYISANPQNPVGFNLRGTCYEKRGQYEKAVYDYRSALKLSPDNLEYNSNLSRAVEEFNKLLYNNIAGYRREIAIDPNKAVNYLEIGKSYKSLGEWMEAENWYDEYLARKEASADEILRYTEILAKNKHISKGEPILNQYTQKYPQDHRLWSRYGYFTMWLGKKNISIHAFETALELRPYFKEAMDGYDLVRGKGYIYTINDTTTTYNYGLPIPRRYQQYAIDKYYGMIKKNPDDIDTRYLLIRELLKNNRFEEAVQQLEFLALTQSDEKKYQDVRREVLEQRDQFYVSEISSLHVKLSLNPEDRKTILELGKYFSYREEYQNAIKLYGDYLEIHPDDNQIRYQKALMYSWSGELKNARYELEYLLELVPNNRDYQLLYGQNLVWMNEDLDIAEKNLNTVLYYEPNNLQALITLASLNFQKNDLANAKEYLNRGYLIDPLNKDLVKLEESIKLQAHKNRESATYRLLEQAREYAFKKECDNAIGYYNEYFADPLSDPYLRKELAEVYLCKDDFDEAVKIYDEMIVKYPNDYDLVKQRAKVYYWSGDSMAALSEFEKLSTKFPEDAETRLYLGDSYMKIGDYKNARLIYEEMLAVSPTSHILQTRMKWLGSAGLEGFSQAAFPTHFSIIPDAYYFNDNLDFTYNTQGLRLELGITNYLSFGFGGFLGTLSSESKKLSLNIVRADAFVRFSKFVFGRVSAGITNFANDQHSNIFEASIKTEKEKKYKFAASFYSSDAAQLLYSPYLVDVRFTANYTSLSGEYITDNAVILKADYSYISVSDNNNGSRVILKAGKIFEEVFGLGYEYYYYNFKNQSTLYWSPRNFESHSAWADWDAVVEDNFLLNLQGKIGLIPGDNFIVREFNSYLSYKFTQYFILQARLSFSSSIQFNRGYNSISMGLTAYWSL